jgi:hypothetical protein
MGLGVLEAPVFADGMNQNTPLLQVFHASYAGFPRLLPRR